MRSTNWQSLNAQRCTSACKQSISIGALFVAVFCQLLLTTEAVATTGHSSTRHHQSLHTSERHTSERRAFESHESHHSHRGHSVTQYASAAKSALHLRGRHHHVIAGKAEKHHVKAATRYAYPLDFFLAKPPAFDTSPLPDELAADIRADFYRGTADSYAPRTLVKAGVVSYHPIRGGIFWRREPIKYIVVHSTEPGVNQSAERIIESWSSMGRRHPGAQYVVDRDGTILQALDPDLATVHVNIFKTLPGINNDDSVGIEMCHTGKQDYPPAQVDSVTKLVVYLQNRYRVQDANIVTHRYAQQGDHTDPVNFDWPGFLAGKNILKNQALALKFRDLTRESLTWLPPDLMPPPDNFLQIHRQLGSHKDDKNVIEIKPPEEAPIAVPAPIIIEEAIKPARPITVSPPPLPAPARASMPNLRGPIEMLPGEASLLNRPGEAPTPGQPQAK